MYQRVDPFVGVQACFGSGRVCIWPSSVTTRVYSLVKCRPLSFQKGDRVWCTSASDSSRWSKVMGCINCMFKPLRYLFTNLFGRSLGNHEVQLQKLWKVQFRLEIQRRLRWSSSLESLSPSLHISLYLMLACMLHSTCMIFNETPVHIP